MNSIIQSVSLFWDKEGHLVFSSVGFKNIGTKKQLIAVQLFVNRLELDVKKETERINKLK